MNNDYKRCDYVIEATHEEAFGCWKQFIKHNNVSWSNGQGFARTLSAEDVPELKVKHNLPVTVSVIYHEVGPQKTLMAFYESTGIYTDWNMIEAWVKKNICSEAKPQLLKSNEFFSAFREVAEKAGIKVRYEPAEKHCFSMSVGDTANKGHGKVKKFFVEANYSMKNIHSFYLDGTATEPMIDVVKMIDSSEGHSVISGPGIQRFIDGGFKFSNSVITDKNIEYVLITPKEFIQLYMFVAEAGRETKYHHEPLEYKFVDDEIQLGGYHMVR